MHKAARITPLRVTRTARISTSEEATLKVAATPSDKQGEGRMSKAKRTIGPKTIVAVDDESTSRTAGAIAKTLVWGAADDFYSREVDVTVTVWPSDDEARQITRDSHVFVEVEVAHYVAANRDESGKLTKKRITFEEASLGDLPLIAMALQSALKVGVRDGSFPKVEGV